MSEEQHAIATPTALAVRIVETSRYLFVVVDGEFRVTYASPVALDLLGYHPASMIGVAGLDLIHPDDVGTALDAFAQLIAESDGRLGVGIPLPARVLTASGSYRHFEIGAQVLLDDPEVAGVVLRLRPIDGPAALDESLHLLVEGLPLDDVLPLVARSVAAEVSPARSVVAFDWNGTRFAGAVPDELPAVLCGTVAYPGAPWEAALAGERITTIDVDDLTGELASAARAEGLGACWVVPVPFDTIDRQAVLVVWREHAGPPWVSHVVALERVARLLALAFRRRHDDAALRHAALHDRLTGLANRARFFDAVEQLLATRGSETHGVIYLDLDDFKPVNDRLGHLAGDEVLRVVAARLLAEVRSDDLVARLGGDEFAVLCPQLPDPVALDDVAQRIVTAVSAPIAVGDAPAGPVRVAASVGGATVTGHDPALTADEWVERADSALRTAKAAGKSTWRRHGA